MNTPTEIQALRRLARRHGLRVVYVRQRLRWHPQDGPIYLLDAATGAVVAAGLVDVDHARSEIAARAS